MPPNKTSVSYRLMKPGEEAGAVDLVLRVFAEFVAPQYSDEGIAELGKIVSVDAIAKRSAAGNFLLLAEDGRTLAGVIEIRDHSHIALLFVEKSRQRKGIARELLKRAIEICRSKKPDIDRITVNSSPNAFEAYRRMGFEKVEDEKVIKGIRFIPMELILDQNNDTQSVTK